MATTNPRLQKTHALGQSIWYDNMRRGLLRSGELAALVQAGVRGLTSNPTIFEKAIVSSSDYEDALQKLVADRQPPTSIYEELVLEDIRGACDLLLPVFDESHGEDGRVSLEVLPELAANTEETVSEGLRLAHLVGRPNVMIKVPATPEGLPAIRALTASGVSVNVTLIFSLAQYEQVLEAYVAGLEERIAAGGQLTGLASVASFFVSRVDAACDKLLGEKAKASSGDEAARCKALMGKLAIANAKMAYEIYGRVIAGPRWKALAAKGARPQRLLWASTGTKDPRYPDTMYIDGLIGQDTVNTVPPATLAAFMDHGTPAATLAADVEGARRAVAEFFALGFDLGRVCQGLLADGVKAFETSMTTLIDAVGARRAAILEQVAGRQRPVLSPPLSKLADAEVARLGAEEAPRRLWASDPTLFTADPAHEKSIRSRLGWLRAPAAMEGAVPPPEAARPGEKKPGQRHTDRISDLEAFAAEVRQAGFTEAVLLGMGGSSLAPEVISLTYGAQARGLRLHVLDNTDPAAVARVDKLVDGKQTLYIVASKSGGTIEIQAFERYFWNKVLVSSGGNVARAGACFVAITDPATRLGDLAAEKKYRRVFINAADIGGRYSALSYFGLVPAALLGADLRGLVESAVGMAQASAPVVPAPENPGLVLGATLGAAAQAGRDKLTLIASPEVASLGSWIEQLVAESTGKDGKGIVPVDGEPIGPPDVYGPDRLFVYTRFGEGRPDEKAAVAALERAGQPVIHIAMEDRAALGREFYRWEVATAIAGAALAVNPFDEPNVTEAKLATSAILAAHSAEGRLPQPEGVCRPGDVERIRSHLFAAAPGDYIAFCAYFMPTHERDAALARLRVACRDRTRNATTVGYGPRFLHSTGQLHKGGANNGVFLQITSDAVSDLPIPGESYSFATLRNAQALGDLQVLERRGRRVLRVHLGSDVDGGLAALVAAVEGTSADAARKTA